MLHLLDESSNVTLSSVIHLQKEAIAAQEHLEYTAESSLFISHPSDSSIAEEPEPFEIAHSESVNASSHASTILSEEEAEENLQNINPNGEEKSQENDLEEFLKLGLSDVTAVLTHPDKLPVTDMKLSRDNDTRSFSSANDSSEENPSAHLRLSTPTRRPTNQQPSFGTLPLNGSIDSLRVSLRGESLRSESDSEFQNSSFLDDTKAQFDLDINIDEYQLSAKQRKGSPWRNFRSASPAPLLQRQTNLFSKRDFSQASATGVASTEKIEDLSKQLTNCKIQLKLYEKFLQDLIDSQSISMDEISTFRPSIDKMTSLNTSETREFQIAEISPEKELMEMANLLEDLYANLEDYQAKWRDADGKVACLNTSIARFTREIDSLLQMLGVTKSVLDEVEGSESQLDHALQVLQHLLANRDLPTVYERLNHHLERNFNAEEERESLSPRKHATKHVPHDFGFSGENSMPKRSTHQQLADISINNKLQEYQEMIDRLQKEVNDLKDKSRTGSISDISDRTSSSHKSREHEKLFVLQKDYENLQAAHDGLIEEHHRHIQSLDRTIASLKGQMENLHKDKMTLRSELAAMSSMQRDLEMSVEKQRVLTTEKIKLSYQVESLKQDKVSLQKNIEKLTERITSMSEKNAPKLEGLRRKAGIASDVLYRIFEVDVIEFENLFKSFNMIADDTSLENPKKRIEFMATFKGAKLLDQKSEVITSVEEAHKSVLRYFSRAVKAIVSDHIRLLLKENEMTSAHDHDVEKLKNQIKILEELSRRMTERPEIVHSPRLKLRIEELTNRWKAEREARILENRQAKKRLQELGQEN